MTNWYLTTSTKRGETPTDPFFLACTLLHSIDGLLQVFSSFYCLVGNVLFHESALVINDQP